MKLRDLRSQEVRKQTDAELIKVTTDGKGKMPAYKSKLTDAEISAILTGRRSVAQTFLSVLWTRGNRRAHVRRGGTAQRHQASLRRISNQRAANVDTRRRDVFEPGTFLRNFRIGGILRMLLRA